MTGFKEIKIYQPDSIKKEFDLLSDSGKRYTNIYDLDEDRQRKREMEHLNTLEVMKYGYKEMAEINLQYAEMSMKTENDDLNDYESVLSSESE